MYICERCKKEYDELPTYQEDFGYDVGIGRVQAWQTMVANCSCGGDIVEATECEECGNLFIENGEQTICDECLEEYKTFDNAIKIGNKYKVRVNINQFLKMCFTEDEIEEILERELREAKKLGKSFNKEVEEYLNDNEWLSENIKDL